MFRSTRLMLRIFVPGLFFMAGCGGQQQWEVSVENQAAVPCSFFVTLGADGNSNASVENLAQGKQVTLVVGDAATVIQTVKVVRGSDEHSLTPKAPLPVGMRYSITVGADGKLDTAVTDR